VADTSERTTLEGAQPRDVVAEMAQAFDALHKALGALEDTMLGFAEALEPYLAVEQVAPGVTVRPVEYEVREMDEPDPDLTIDVTLLKPLPKLPGVRSVEEQEVLEAEQEAGADGTAFELGDRCPGCALCTEKPRK